MTAGPFVIDTNVLVAGLLTRERTAPTSRILDAMLSGEIFYLLSEPLLAEYRAVRAQAPDFIRYCLHQDNVKGIIAYFEGIKDGEKFRAGAQEALELGKPTHGLRSRAREPTGESGRSGGCGRFSPEPWPSPEQ